MTSPVKIGTSNLRVGLALLLIDAGATAGNQYDNLDDLTNFWRWGINASGNFTVDYYEPPWFSVMEV